MSPPPAPPHAPPFAARTAEGLQSPGAWGRTSRGVALALGGLLALGLLASSLDAGVDLGVAAWFWTPADGFVWRDAPVPQFLHTLVQIGARVLAAVLILGLGGSAWRRRPLAGLDARAWLFLALSLGVGPGLIGNSLLKDHWHRARPVQVRDFGGAAPYTPPLLPAPKANCGRNCSFVSGDAVLGFYLPTFAYVLPPGDGRRRRLGRALVFWGGLLLGAGTGLLRIGMGGHFFSDVLYAAVLATGVSALFFGAMYGRQTLWRRWAEWFGVDAGPQTPVGRP